MDVITMGIMALALFGLIVLEPKGEGKDAQVRTLRDSSQSGTHSEQPHNRAARHRRPDSVKRRSRPEASEGANSNDNGKSTQQGKSVDSADSARHDVSRQPDGAEPVHTTASVAEKPQPKPATTEPAATGA